MLTHDQEKYTRKLYKFLASNFNQSPCKFLHKLVQIRAVFCSAQKNKFLVKSISQSILFLTCPSKNRYGTSRTSEGGTVKG